jgi:hypothetical protein
MTDQTHALTVETRPRPSMAVGGNVGALIPQDIEQAFRIASALAQSGMTPNGFKTPETCFVAIMAGAELGLPPFQSLQSFAIINNRPTLWGDALMAVVRTNGFKVREWLEGEGDEMTAYCEVIRPDNGDTAEASFSVDDAKTAGLWKKGGPWTSAPKRMLKMRARSFAIRDGAADVLRGFQIREEVEDYAEPLPSDAAPKAGTGLLARLETTQTLATEGFGIRNLADEAGEAAPAAEPAPPKGRKVSAKIEKALAKREDAIDAALAAKTADALAAIAEAEPEIVAQVVEDHADDDAFPGDARADPENLPADAQVEETATQTPATVIDGPAPADTLYFMADKEAFPSGRRVVFFNGNSEKEAIDDTPDVQTYTEHAPKGPPMPVEREPIPSAPALEWTAQDDFAAELNGAKDGAEIVLAVRTLLASGECGTPDLKRAARVKAWLRVIDLNAGGAKIDPVADPFLMSAFIEWSEDVEAVQSMLPLAAEQEWFKAGGETMQNGVSRAIMDRVAALTGAR